MDGNKAEDAYGDRIRELLAKYYRVRDHEAEEIAGKLIDCIEKDIRRWTTPYWQQGEREDLCQEARIKLARGLVRSRSNPQIADFFGYAKSTSQLVLWEWLRKRNPLQSINAHLYYLASSKCPRQTFTRWKLQGEWLYGLQSDSGRHFNETPEYRSFFEDAQSFLNLWLNGKSLTLKNLPTFLEPLFLYVATPLREQKLVDYLGSILSLDSFKLPEEAIDGDLPAPEHEGVGRIDFTDVWKIISSAGIPRVKRRALLLSLDSGAIAVLIGMPSPIGEFAEAIEVSLEEAQALWKHLPLESEQIMKMIPTDSKNYLQKEQSEMRRLLREACRNFWRG